MGLFSTQRLAPLLLGFALALSLLSVNLGWFSVDTKIQVWEYSRTAPDGKGNTTGLNPRVDMEMKMFELNTQIRPKNFHDAIKDSVGLPTYGDQAGRTGTAMRGLFFLEAVAVLGLVGSSGFYLWNRRSGRDYSLAVWKFAGLFGAFSLLTMGYLALAVPAGAEEDTREVLNEYVSFLPNFPHLDPAMLSPQVKFWNTWTCCGREGIVKFQSKDYLVVVTTSSRPSAGFWLQATELALVAGALALATRAGHFEPKPEPRGSEGLATPAPPKAA